jgi:hypothetical protein
MIIYKVGEADAGERWHPTLAKAQNCARAYKGTIQDIHAGEDGREGMCAMLNGGELTIHERHDEPVEAEQPKAEPFMLKPDANSVIEASQIEQFILERATVAQVCNIMECLGSRFGELVKEKRK